MTKIKKMSKIIPTVLLSGAMIMPISQLTSPVIANACEISNYNTNNNSSSLKFKFSINGDPQAATVVLANGDRTTEVSIDSNSTQNSEPSKPNVCIKDLNKVNDLEMEINNTSSKPLKVKFFVNGDRDTNCIFRENGKYNNELTITPNSKKTISIECGGNVNKLEIKVTNLG